jgi:hypothetical protein
VCARSENNKNILHDIIVFLQYANVSCHSPANTFAKNHELKVGYRTLEGSCHCGLVEFTLESHTPVPYQLCACTICRKVGGYSGSVNLGGIADTLKITKGKDVIK